jgi:hypothetical protein
VTSLTSLLKQNELLLDLILRVFIEFLKQEVHYRGDVFILSVDRGIQSTIKSDVNNQKEEQFKVPLFGTSPWYLTICF